MEQNELKFHRLLASLAHQCNFALDEITIEIYDKHLSQFGYENLNKAIEAIIIYRKSKDAFPSVREIQSRFKPELTQNDSSNTIANKVWLAVSKFGAYRWKDAKEWLGHPANKVAEQMGWDYLCKLDADQGPFVLAQLRDLAKAVWVVSETIPSGERLLEHDIIADQASSILQEL